MPEHERRYTDREMAVILRIATEVEARSSGARPMPGARGRTLREIEAIASDAGIAPEAVRAAVAALEASDETGLMGKLLGAPTMFRLERHVPGEIEAREMLELTGTARWVMAHEGELRDHGDGVEWQHHTAEGPLTHLELASRAGQTRIRLLAKYDDPAAWTLIGGVGSAGVLSAVAITLVEPGLVPGIGIIGAAGLTAWAGTRVVWRRVASRARARLTGLMQRLEGQARELTAEPGSARMLEQQPAAPPANDAERG